MRQLREAIRWRHDYFFETTLGGETITRTLEFAVTEGLEVRIWYAGLTSPELHIARVAARVRRGGHAIPADTIRRRYDRSRLNLIRLLPHLTELRVYDNSQEADPATGAAPAPVLVLHTRRGKIIGPPDLSPAPEWAKPIVAAALRSQPAS